MDQFDVLLHQWREGERRVTTAAPEQQPALYAVTDRLVADLRRRLGGPFTTRELVELYEQGTGWTLDVAVSVAPGAPWAWEARTVADAAFARYVRDAVDFAGGRRIDPDP